MHRKLHPLAYASLIGMSTISPFSSYATNLKEVEIPYNQAAQNAKPDEYIVVYHHNIDASIVDDAMGNINSENGPNERALHRFSLLNGFAGKVTPARLQQLMDDPQVKTIEANLTLTATTSSTTASAASWGLDRIDQTNLPLDGNYSVHGDGNGAHAYIIDSGILLTHNEFGGRASWGYTASDINDGDMDGMGRGTHMAGTVGGATYGVASNVNLHAVKVLNNSGVGSLAGLIEGIEYVTNNHQAPAVAVIGMSTGFSQTLNDALAASAAAGVSYAVATGDDGRVACDYSPASSTEVMTVAATWDNDNISGSSNDGSCVDIFAPGLYITSAWHTGDHVNNTISHSPMAAAHVAGAAAVVRGNDPSCNVTQVKEKLLGYSSKDVLNQVPANTPNILLGVPQSAEASVCSQSTGIHVQYDHRVQLNSDASVNIDFVAQGSALPVQHGTLIWDTDHYVYSPQSGYRGLDSFDYFDAQSQRKTVRIEVGMNGNSSEISVDNTGQNQYYTRVVPLANGDFLASWYEQVGAYTAAMFQRFNALGEAVTAKTQAHSVNRAQTEPVAGYTADGGFIIAWVENTDVYAKIFSANNVPGNAFVVPSVSTGNQSDPAITTLNNGNFVISWDQENAYRLKGNLYNPQGVKLVDGFVLADAVGGIHRESNVKALVDGGFMGMGSADRYIMARKFDENGNIVGTNVVPTAFAGDASQHKQVTMAELADGRYMLGWTTTYSDYGHKWTVMGRIYNPDNSPVTGEFVINQFDPDNQMGLGLLATHDGEFLAIWQSQEADNNGQSVMGRRFDRDGNSLSDEFRITHNWAGNQQQPDINTLVDGQVAMSFADSNGGNLKLKIAMLTLGGAAEDIFQGDDHNNTFIGKGGHNTVYAGAGDDIIFDGTLAYGGEGRDVFYRGLVQFGQQDDDDFYIGSGQSFIDGGEGYDVVFFTGNYGDYSVVDQGNGYFTVSDLRVDNPDGVDNQLTSIEAIQFADHRFQLDDSQNQPIRWTSRVQTNSDTAVSIDFNDLTQGSINSAPTNGSLLWSNGSYQYTPNAGFGGLDSFIYLGDNNELKTVRVEVGMHGNSSTYQVDSGSGDQKDSRVVGLNNGDLLVSWTEITNGYTTAYIQRFNSLGQAQTSRALVHSAAAEQTNPVIGALANGGYVVAWEQGTDIYTKRYDSNNVGESVVLANTKTTGNQTDPAITTLVNGDYVIAWDAEQSYAFMGNLYSPEGIKRKRNILLTDTIGGIRSEVNVKATADGGFNVMGSSAQYMVSRKFGHNGVPVNGTKVLTNASWEADQHKQITMAELPDGRYMLGWTATEQQDGSLWSMVGRVYNADNTPFTNEFVINQYAYGNQKALGLAATESGEFIALWQSYAADHDGNGWGIMARRYNRDGVAISDEFRIVDNWQGHQYRPDITVLNNGQMALSYSDRIDGSYKVKVAMLTIGGEAEDILQGNSQNNVLIGAGGSNRIYAEAGDDWIVDGTLAYGGPGDDTFKAGLVNFGEAGNDDFYIGAGSSSIDGGDDYDVAIFSGNYSDYAVIDNGNGSYTVNDNRVNNPDGLNNQISHVEALEFADQRIVLNATTVTPWTHLVQMAASSTVNLDFASLLSGTIDVYPQNGSLIFDSGSNSYVYTPTNGFSGIESFTYIDGNGDTQLVRLEIGLSGSSAGVQVQSSNPAQTYSRVMALSNGDFIVTWYERSNNINTVMYQRFNSAGQSVTFATAVHSSNAAQTEPVVSYLTHGGFVVAWVEDQDVYAKIFDANNNGGSAFLVPLVSGTIQSDPAIATLANGDFVIGWDAEASYSFLANIYNPDGVQIKANISLIEHIGGIRSEINLKATKAGGFIAVGSADKYIVTRRFSHTGEPLNSGVTPSSAAKDAPQHKQVTMAELADGRYMVGWTSTEKQDGSGLSVMARIYHPDDTPLTAEFVVNQYGSNDQQALGIVATDNGDFMSVWQSYGADGDNNGIRARLFDRDGVALTAEFQLVGNTQGSQFAPDIQNMANGQLALSYSDGISGTGQVVVEMISLGDDGDDIFYDTDIALGGNGNDKFYGGKTFDGGAGNDSLHLSGMAGDYSVVDNGDGSFKVIDNRSGSPDGTMVLRQVETIYFSDTNVAL